MKNPNAIVKTVLLLISLLLLPAPVSAQGDAPVVHKLAPTLQQKVQFLNPEYLVYAPVESSNAKLPLLIFLHGAGGVGQDIQQIKARPTDVWKGIEKFGKGPCIVVAPQCLKTANGERGIWTVEDLNLLLQHLKATLPVDDRRIYLSGISMGGYGTWAWAANDPQHFAAIAPIVGGIGREGAKAVTPDFDRWAANLATIPVYAFVGALDTTVPPERSERMIAAIKKAGGKQAKLKVYPDEGHGAGRVVVADAEYFDWIFAQQRDASPQAEVSTAGPGTIPGKLYATSPHPMNSPPAPVIDRRHFLRGLGLTLALPAFESLNVDFASPAPQADPRRLICIGNHLGFWPGGFFPTAEGRDYAISRTLTPLQAHRGDFTVFSHLDHGAKGGHGAVHSFLTGVKKEESTKFPEKNILIDQVAAGHVGAATRYPSITAGIGEGTDMRWNRGGMRIPPVNNPPRLFDGLFVDASPGAKASERERLSHRASVLDVLRESAKQLSGYLDAADRGKLDQYLTSVRDVEGRLKMSEASLGRPKPKSPSLPGFASIACAQSVANPAVPVPPAEDTNKAVHFGSGGTHFLHGRFDRESRLLAYLRQPIFLQLLDEG